jgi:5-formyltetrahydrofolate cyclo-ligase
MVDPTQPVPDALASTKSAMRRTMREQRRALPDRQQRSLAIWEHVRSIAAVLSASRLMVFETIAGEPDTAPFLDWCRSAGKQVAVPNDDVDPHWPDVVIVPGLAFTTGGDRLGQGGGWYDRFLSGARADCTTIGVAFDVQVVERLPVEPHDVPLDHVVTESGVGSRSSTAAT